MTSREAFEKWVKYNALEHEVCRSPYLAWQAAEEAQAATIAQLEHALVSEALNKQDYAQLQAQLDAIYALPVVAWYKPNGHWHDGFILNSAKDMKHVRTDIYSISLVNLPPRVSEQKKQSPGGI